MQFVKLQKQGPFVSLFYTLTWPIGWEHMLCFADALISSDLIKKPERIRCQAAAMGTPPRDVTDQLQAKSWRLNDTDLACNEMSTLVVEGFSTLMESHIRLCLYNQTDRCLLQVLGHEHFDKHGEHCFDKFADSIELMGHLQMERQKSAGAWLPGSVTEQKGAAQ